MLLLFVASICECANCSWGTGVQPSMLDETLAKRSKRIIKNVNLGHFNDLFCLTTKVFYKATVTHV